MYNKVLHKYKKMTPSPNYENELAACLVGPIFLPPCINISRSKTIKPDKVARCLFGTADSKDIAQLTRENNEENAERMKQRYNFEIRKQSQVTNSLSISDDEGTAAKNSDEAAEEDLIEREMQSYHRNLRGDKLQQTAENTPRPKIVIPTHKNKRNNCSVGGIHLANKSIPTSSTGGSNERQKPYERQTKMTEQYVLRKELKRAPTSDHASKLGAAKAVLNERTQIEANTLNEEEKTPTTVQVYSTSGLEAKSTSSTAVTLPTAQEVTSTSSAVTTTSTTKTVAAETASQLS